MTKKTTTNSLVKFNVDMMEIFVPNPTDEKLLCRYLCKLTEKILHQTGEADDMHPFRKYGGANCENETFEMRSFWHGRCRCKYGLIIEQRSEHFRRSRWTQKRDADYARFLETHEHAPDCLMHPDNNRSELPNFRYEDFEIRWYKHIGCDMRLNRPITRQEIEAMFQHCFDSLTA